MQAPFFLVDGFDILMFKDIRSLEGGLQQYHVRGQETVFSSDGAVLRVEKSGPTPVVLGEAYRVAPAELAEALRGNLALPKRKRGAFVKKRTAMRTLDSIQLQGASLRELVAEFECTRPYS